MKPNKLIITISILTLVILGLGVWLISRPTAGSQLGATTAAGAKAEVGATDFDWGNIDYGGGDVTAEFDIKNSGSGPLSLAEVSTSCMCTTAQIMINGQKSPFFGMHQKSSWIGQLSAGGQEFLHKLDAFLAARSSRRSVGKIPAFIKELAASGILSGVSRQFEEYAVAKAMSHCGYAPYCRV